MAKPQNIMSVVKPCTFTLLSGATFRLLWVITEFKKKEHMSKTSWGETASHEVFVAPFSLLAYGSAVGSLCVK